MEHLEKVERVLRLMVATAEAVAAVSEEAPAAAAVPAGAGKTKIKDYLIEIVLFFMLILLHHTAS